MIQINLLFIDLNVHLHRDQFEIFCIILPQVLHVMITGYEIDFPIQPLSIFVHSAEPPRQKSPR